jgi:hypothetical protein
MKVKKILTEWRTFIKEEQRVKTPIEASYYKMKDVKLNEDFVNEIAAAHIIRLIEGVGLSNVEGYMDSVSFGKSNAQRMAEILSSAQLMQKYFNFGYSEQVDYFSVPLEVDVLPTASYRFPISREEFGKNVAKQTTWGTIKSDLKVSLTFKGTNPKYANKIAVFENYQTLEDVSGAMREMLLNGEYDFKSLAPIGPDVGYKGDPRDQPSRAGMGGAQSAADLFGFPQWSKEFPQHGKDAQAWRDLWAKTKSDFEDATFAINMMNSSGATEKEIKMAQEILAAIKPKIKTLMPQRLEAANKVLKNLMSYKTLPTGQEVLTYTNITNPVKRIQKEIESVTGMIEKINTSPEFEEKKSIDDLYTAALSGDKAAAKEAFKIFRANKENVKAMEMRNVMRGR